MSRLEDELRAALGREEPPPGFAERVAAQVRPGGFPRLRWVAALAACLLLAAGGLMERERRERVRGEMAKQQVMLAFGITGSKLQFIKEKIHAMHSEQR